MLEWDLMQLNCPDNFFSLYCQVHMFSRWAFPKMHNSDFRGCYVKKAFQIIKPLLYLLSYIGTLLYSSREFSFRETKSASNLIETVQAKLWAKKFILKKEQDRNYTK